MTTLSKNAPRSTTYHTTHSTRHTKHTLCTEDVLLDISTATQILHVPYEAVLFLFLFQPPLLVWRRVTLSSVSVSVSGL